MSLSATEHIGCYRTRVGTSKTGDALSIPERNQSLPRDPFSSLASLPAIFSNTRSPLATSCSCTLLLAYFKIGCMSTEMSGSPRRACTRDDGIGLRDMRRVGQGRERDKGALEPVSETEWHGVGEYPSLRACNILISRPVRCSTLDISCGSIENMTRRCEF